MTQNQLDNMNDVMRQEAERAVEDNLARLSKELNMARIEFKTESDQLLKQQREAIKIIHPDFGESCRTQKLCNAGIALKNEGF